MNCSYCSLGSYDSQYRKKKVEYVLKEIEIAVVSHNARFIDFEDEHLALGKNRFLFLLNEIKRRFGRYNIELRAMNGLFPSSLDTEIIQVMKESGFKTLNLSLGSTSGRQLQQFQRPDVRNDLDRVLDIAEKFDLETVCYIIAGAPNQNADSSVDDLQYLAGKKALAGVSIFYPSPGSSDYNLSKKLEILPKHFSIMRSSTLPISHTTKRIESITILRLGRILNFMKALIRNDSILPPPKSYKNSDSIKTENRTELGKKILQWFLYDGRIKGITPEGEIFEHTISERLTQKFLKNLPKIR